MREFHTHTHLTAVVEECVHGLPDGLVWGLAGFDLGLEVVVEVGPHHEVVLAPLVHSDLGFSLNHGVDASNCRTHTTAVRRSWMGVGSVRFSGFRRDGGEEKESSADLGGGVRPID